MATYSELYDLFANSALRNRVAVACLVAADTIRGEAPATPNHTARLAWAKLVFERPEDTAAAMTKAVLAANRTLTTGQITNASDAGIQTAVDNAVNLFAGG